MGTEMDAIADGGDAVCFVTVADDRAILFPPLVEILFLPTFDSRARNFRPRCDFCGAALRIDQSDEDDGSAADRDDGGVARMSRTGRWFKKTSFRLQTPNVDRPFLGFGPEQSRVASELGIPLSPSSPVS
jgi:hypothetical protein